MNSSATGIDIKESLIKAEQLLKGVILKSFEELEQNPEKEKEIIDLLIQHGKNLNDYFFEVSEKRGNDKLAKSLIKHVMFKKF